MYGPRSSYDSATLARWDEQLKDNDFARRLIAALRRPDVRKALKEAEQLAHEEAARVAGKTA